MCAARARPRGASLPLSSPYPNPTPGFGGYHLPFPSGPSPSPRTSRPPTFLFTPPPGSPPPPPIATLGYCFRVRGTFRMKELRLGVGPGPAALAMPRSRVGDPPAGRRPETPRSTPRGEIRPFLLPFLYRLCAFPGRFFPKFRPQPTQHPPPTIGSVSRNAVLMALIV